MNNKLTAKERRHVAKIKEMNCGVCGKVGPSDCHHIRQHRQYLCIPLCKDCHTNKHGIHGTKLLWEKTNELEVLNETIKAIDPARNIEQMNCGVCGEEGPSIGHQIKPDSIYLAVPLCNDCLNGRFNGWHGEKRMWKLLKMDELDVLNETLRKILE